MGIFRKFMCVGVMIAMFFVLSGIVSATTIEVTNEVTGTDISTGQATYKVNVYDSNNVLIGTYEATRDVFNHIDAVPGDPCNSLPELDRYDENHECPLSTLAQDGMFYGSKNPQNHIPGPRDWIEIGSASGSREINAGDNPSGDKRSYINFHPLGTYSLGCMGIANGQFSDFYDKVNTNGDVNNGNVRVKIKDRYTQTGDGIKRCCTTSDGKSGCQTCSGGSWGTCGACPEDQWCEEGECVPEASTLVLFAVGLLCLAGYIGLKKRKAK